MVHHLSAPPNTAPELTPLCVERDRRDFEGWFPLDAFALKKGDAAQREAVGLRATPAPNLRIATLRCAHLCYTISS
jgi:hypothetical protein